MRKKGKIYGLTNLSAEIVNQMHFGGSNLNENYRPDGTKEEIYSELIAKVKCIKRKKKTKDLMRGKWKVLTTR